MEIPDWQCTASHCSFCGKHVDRIKILIVGPNAIGICEECVSLCVEIIKEQRNEKAL